MRTLAVVNAIGLTSFALRPLREERCALDLALAAARALPGVDRVLVFADRADLVGPACARARALPRVRPAWDTRTLLEQMWVEGEGFDHVYHMFGDCPYVDPELAARMLENHIRYYADYTFADGYPLGLAVDILKRAVLDPLCRLAADHPEPLGRDVVFRVVQHDINAFDLETEISPVDLRWLRLTLAADTTRNHLLLERLEAKGVRSAADVTSTVVSSPEILRTLPAYCSVQIVEGCPQLCSYCPYPGTILKRRGVQSPGKAAQMPLDRFSTILQGLQDLCGDAVVSVSLWGEPSLHSGIAELVVEACTRPGLTLHVETSGIGWPAGALERIHTSGARPVWIVSLDAWSPQVYGKLRGQGFAEATRAATRLLELFPESTYVQAVRMRGNEEDTEAFYRAWKERSAKTIIQKYDAFAGRLEDLKVSDLRPLKRNPCWHLKRDLTILLDGSVPMCREILGTDPPLGNVFTDGLPVVWQRGQEPYLLHLAERYPEVCQSCDEYYTYNA